MKWIGDDKVRTIRLGLAMVRLGLATVRNAKGHRCDLEWVSVWVEVFSDLEWDLECLFATVS